MNPSVKLVSWTQDPMAVVWILWEASKVDGEVPMDVETVKRTVSQADLEKLFWQVLRQHIPISENIHFTFVLDGISVSLREQMVRHRIGVHVGDNFGVDVIPDIADSSWWSQSMRIQDMSRFAARGMYRVPETLNGLSEPNTEHPDNTATGIFHDTMRAIESGYTRLVNMGVPMEDARELIPLGAQHRISWDLNLAALLHILGKRGCWILQLGIWGPIIHGMVSELVSKIHPMFSRIVAPPCIDHDDHFTSCQYRLENQRRMPDHDSGVVHDAHPPCPLWLCRDQHGQIELGAVSGGIIPGANSAKQALISADNLVPRHREMKARAEQYRPLWRHDPYTWTKE